MLSPILEKLTADSDVKSGSGKSLDLVTIDTDAEVALAQQYSVRLAYLPLNAALHIRLTSVLGVQIRSLPTVIAFVDGEPVSQFMGAMPEPSVRNFINTI
ncbi:hypothetical protein EUX98_g7586 [Antrodiella citrinella]|uniref:Thioredoxin domain-containing protein n=1 Tax=Antrodiella citrinella TaxID=2447956 RepID=A0A4S4MLG4_9APHY|nr:hypothetical protein EUX98_g7586 [Antrodiella citrinella]